MYDVLFQELESLRNATRRLIDEASTKRGDPDYWFNDEIPETWFVTSSSSMFHLTLTDDSDFTGIKSNQWEQDN